MKKYEILTKEDFYDFRKKLGKFILLNEHKGLHFEKMNIIVKKYRKDKTPKQHRYYWAVMSEVSKAFQEVGYSVSSEQAHEFMKKAHGFTTEIINKNGEVTHITKSISDGSEDVNIKVMMDLIDFAIRWCAINLDYIIKDPRTG